MNRKNSAAGLLGSPGGKSNRKRVAGYRCFAINDHYAWIVSLVALFLAACSSQPSEPETIQSEPVVPVSVKMAGMVDKREGFLHLYCQINRQAGAELPDYRDCEDALVAPESAAETPDQSVDRSSTKQNVDIIMVPGLGYDCIQEYVGTASGKEYLDSLGYSVSMPSLEGLSSSNRNAQLIYAHLVDNHLLDNGRKLVFIAYSKGVPDVLDALVQFPDMQRQTLAVISIAGAVWGTPIAETTPEKMLGAYNLVPGKDCKASDMAALESLKPAARQQWMADNSLPEEIRYYSVVTDPAPDNISSGLLSSYKQLSKIDPRNDSQLIYYDQVIPGSTLLAYLNADHLAIAVPISRGHPWIGKMALSKNGYPREILLESALRFIEADLINDPTTRARAVFSKSP